MGKYPELSLADARKEALRVQREAADDQTLGNGHRLVVPVPVDQVITYGGLVQSYTELHLRPNTRAKDAGAKVFGQAVMQEFLTRDVTTIRRAEIVALLDQVVAEGKPHGAGNLLKSLHAMFAWAVARDMMLNNPCTGVRAPVRTTLRDRVLTDQELVAVLEACDKMPSPFGPFVRTLMHTGARRNEVAHMKWGELEGNVWTLPADRSKNGRANVLPLAPAVMAILNGLPRYGASDDECGRHFVFTTTGGLRPSSDFSKRKRLLDAESGTSGWRLHDLRRTCRTKMSQLGVTRETARRVVGHSVDNLDARYDQHDHREAKAAALQLIANHLAELVRH